MISKTRLLETERPQRRKRRRTGEPDIGRQDVLHVGPIEDVVVERASLRTEGGCVGRFFAEVEAGSPGVVEQNAGGKSSAGRQEKGDFFVDGVGGFLKGIAVGVPKVIGVISPVKRTRLVA